MQHITQIVKKILHINETNQHYDPLHYVLLFPYGDAGWTIGIQHKSTVKHTSIMNFYAYHMMQRNNFNTILRAGRLFHQYVVDQYAKLEQQRLNYALFCLGCVFFPNISQYNSILHLDIFSQANTTVKICVVNQPNEVI